MKSIDEMVEAAALLDAGKHDHVLTPVFEGRRVSVDTDLVPCLMEHQATTHLAGRLSARLPNRPPVPAGFLNDTCDDDMYAYNLNKLIGRITAKGGKTDWMFRCHDDHVRAVVGQNYPAFGLDGMWENRTLLETMRLIVKSQSNPNIIRPFVSRDRTICKVTFKDVTIGSEHFGIGSAFSNSEVGDGQFEVYGLIQKASCTNSIVINQGWKIKHVGGVFKFHNALDELAKSLGAAGTMAAEWLNKMMYSQRIEIPDFSAAIENISKGYGWDDAVKIEIGIGSEGRENVYGLVNGVTWAAHRQFGDKPDLMFEMEQAAATLLNQYVEHYEKRERRGLGATEFVPVRPQRERVAA
jgi:hypothetical protein